MTLEGLKRKFLHSILKKIFCTYIGSPKINTPKIDTFYETSRNNFQITLEIFTIEFLVKIKNTIAHLIDIFSSFEHKQNVSIIDKPSYFILPVFGLLRMAEIL